MIGKIIAGSSFGATVGYVMKEQSRILSFEGIEPPNVQDMVRDFKDQTLLNPRIKNAVGHISLSFSVKDADKPEAVGVAKRFEALGYKIYATRSTAKYLQEHGVNALRVNKITQESPNVMDLILGHKIDLVIDTPTQGNGDKNRDGFLIRRNAIETGVYCITAMDTANALARSLETATNELNPIDIATVKNL